MESLVRTVSRGVRKFDYFIVKNSPVPGSTRHDLRRAVCAASIAGLEQDTMTRQKYEQQALEYLEQAFYRSAGYSLLLEEIGTVRSGCRERISLSWRDVDEVRFRPDMFGGGTAGGLVSHGMEPEVLFSAPKFEEEGAGVAAAGEETTGPKKIEVEAGGGGRAASPNPFGFQRPYMKDAAAWATRNDGQPVLEADPAYFQPAKQETVQDKHGLDFDQLFAFPEDSASDSAVCSDAPSDQSDGGGLASSCSTTSDLLQSQTDQETVEKTPAFIRKQRYRPRDSTPAFEQDRALFHWAADRFLEQPNRGAYFKPISKLMREFARTEAARNQFETRSEWMERGSHMWSVYKHVICTVVWERGTRGGQGARV